MIYTFRTEDQILARARQTEEFTPTLAPEVVPVRRATRRVTTKPPAALRKTTRTVNKSTLCASCNHSYRDHCAGRQQHFPVSWSIMIANLNGLEWTDGDGVDWDLLGWLSCTTLHCSAGIFEDGCVRWCLCNDFVNPHTGQVLPWRPEVLPETPCARCHHVKAHHCKKSKSATHSFTIVNGSPRVCFHYREWAEAGMKGDPCCTSTSCAECTSCPRFVSPFARAKRKSKSQTAITGALPAPATGSQEATL